MKFLFSLTALLFPLVVFGATKLTNPLGTDSIPALIGEIIKILLGLSGAVALGMFVWGGLLMLISGGNETRIKNGKATLTWAIIGLVVIFSAYTLTSAVIKVLTTGSAA